MGDARDACVDGTQHGLGRLPITRRQSVLLVQFHVKIKNEGFDRVRHARGRTEGGVLPSRHHGLARSSFTLLQPLDSPLRAAHHLMLSRKTCHALIVSVATTITIAAVITVVVIMKINNIVVVVVVLVLFVVPLMVAGALVLITGRARVRSALASARDPFLAASKPTERVSPVARAEGGLGTAESTSEGWGGVSSVRRFVVPSPKLLRP